MKRQFRKPKRLFGHLLFFQVFRQDEEELLGTAETLFRFSLALLFLSVLLTAGLVLVGATQASKEMKATLQALDNESLYAVFWLIPPTFLSALIKMGSFERGRANLLWGSFLCILVGIALITKVLMMLVL